MQDRKKKQVAMLIYRPAEPATFRVNALFQSSINNQLKQERVYNRHSASSRSEHQQKIIKSPEIRHALQ